MAGDPLPELGLPIDVNLDDPGLRNILQRQIELLEQHVQATIELAEQKARDADKSTLLAEAEQAVVIQYQKMAKAEARRAAAVEQLLAEIGDLAVFLRRELAIELGRTSTLIRQLLMQQPLVEAINENAEIQASHMQRLYQVMEYFIQYQSILTNILAATFRPASESEMDQLTDILMKVKTHLREGDDLPLRSPREKQESRASLEKRLQIQRKNLEERRLVSAKHGAFPPLTLTNEISELETIIEILEARLENYEA